jgi:hypothetical protein
LPSPNPRNFHPEQFLEDAHRHLPPDVGTDADFQPENETNVLTDADIAELSARGIAGPDQAARLDEMTEHDDSPADLPVGGGPGDIEMEMPVGALGADPIDFVPSEPEFAQLEEVETPGDDEPLGIDGIGDDVAVGAEGDDTLTIHGGEEETLTSSFETPGFDEDAAGEMQELPSEADPDVGAPMDTVPQEDTPEDF